MAAKEAELAAQLRQKLNQWGRLFVKVMVQKR